MNSPRHSGGQTVTRDAGGRMISGATEQEVAIRTTTVGPENHTPAKPGHTVSTSNEEPNRPLIPVRMLNEYVYCPRLAYLEWIESEWAASADTVEGKHQHKRIDQTDHPAPAPASEPSGEAAPLETRSVSLSSETLGITAKLDLVESTGDRATPVDYKHGKRPHVSRGAYDPERVQLCAQGMLLEEQGFTVTEGVLYYVQSKERVRIPFDQELRDLTRRSISELAALADNPQSPAPLVDSPKCPRCSLVGICLPDEINAANGTAGEIRAVSISQEEALPLHVRAYKASVKKKGNELEVTIGDDPPKRVRINDISQLVVMGNAYVTAPTLQELMRRDIPVSWHSYGGWFNGHTIGTGNKNVDIRIAQYRGADRDEARMDIARRMIAAKIENSRTLLRRNWKGTESPDDTLARLAKLKKRAMNTDTPEELLGVEGSAAAAYFGMFDQLLTDRKRLGAFQFTSRNRRPPTDPVNALLSFAYAMVTRDWTVALSAVGLDPYLGYYHRPRHGRPALALDMMEPFRPLVADSAVLTAVNTGEVNDADFVRAAKSVALTGPGRKAFLSVYERRMSQEITHPQFGYKVSYRRLFELQSRLLSRYLLGELAEPPVFVTR